MAPDDLFHIFKALDSVAENSTARRMFNEKREKLEKTILEAFPEERCMYQIKELDIENAVLEYMERRFKKKGETSKRKKMELEWNKKMIVKRRKRVERKLRGE